MTTDPAYQERADTFDAMVLFFQGVFHTPYSANGEPPPVVFRAITEIKRMIDEYAVYASDAANQYPAFEVFQVLLDSSASVLEARDGQSTAESRDLKAMAVNIGNDNENQFQASGIRP